MLGAVRPARPVAFKAYERTQSGEKELRKARAELREAMRRARAAGATYAAPGRAALWLVGRAPTNMRAASLSLIAAHLVSPAGVYLALREDSAAVLFGALALTLALVVFGWNLAAGVLADARADLSAAQMDRRTSRQAARSANSHR